ncbi:MAG: cytochrome c [Sulfitobacter sp.]|nr:cytochrome c [Sulfitobacter sp.]
MNKSFALLGGLLAAAVIGTAAVSDGHANKAIEAAVKARQAQMSLYAFNIGLLGDMAKGEIEYDAEAATKAASNLAALAQLDQSRLWPPGSDNAALGTDKTKALPAIWTADSTARAKGMALVTAAVAMEQAAGGGLDSLRGAIGDVGKSCGGCHELYRQK